MKEATTIPSITPTNAVEIKDCSGTVNGTAKVDICGICNGDGLSCSGCESTNIKGNKYTIDTNSNSLRNLVLKINKELSAAAKNSGLSKNAVKAINNYVVNANKSAEELYNQLWTRTYTNFPEVVLSCTSTFCVNTSTLSNKADIQSKTKALQALCSSGEAKIKSILATAKKNKVPKLKAVSASAATAKNLVKSSITLVNGNNIALNAIPNSHSSCKNLKK